MNNSYVKRPLDTLAVEFDFTEFAARVGVAVEYLLKAEPGITVSSTVVDTNVMHLLVTGGVLGRVYRFGFEAKTAEGDSLVDMRVLRIRDPKDTAALEDTVKVDAEGVWHALRGDDVVLTDDQGNTLWAQEPQPVLLVNGSGELLTDGQGIVLEQA